MRRQWKELQLFSDHYMRTMVDGSGGEAAVQQKPTKHYIVTQLIIYRARVYITLFMSIHQTDQS